LNPAAPYLLWYMLAASVVTFIVYARDKWAAKRGAWRTPEMVLHLFDALGGWPGGFAAQRMLRHKTSKVGFQILFWLTVALHSGAVLFVVSRE
jgi:uncharacterized membrane protein YsdA (DUF1294 family)